MGRCLAFSLATIVGLLRAVYLDIEKNRQSHGAVLVAQIIDGINRRRIEFSKDLLSATDRTLADIGREIGYTESSSFIRFFRKLQGVTPGQFREQAG